ncbi:CBS / octicosapeptide/Phox/Bemp1 domains-containing protein isoform 2 [Theobroma cacao]|uniref:CBS / octicosapeptide/Phox/Bemp1 domains-containing protein isoform 2 n=1 Tax=Theobroma cacao TaxID=3641 RepID=A0A061DRZ9_THECC|nr:CBS / octicosapeptide/Phox/Bemp1 domains-containing protein isoform 2 [Theobroma cacao]
MSSQAVPPPPASRRNSNKRGPSAPKKSHSSDNAKPTSPSSVGGERTVKKLRLSKALTIPEGTTVSEACRRMAARRVDAVLLTDANALLSGIITDKDIATRVIAEGLRPEQTVVSKIMTRSPIFVTADSLAIEALQKMVQGKFRHLPVVENGEVIALLDITKCLYDAISRMEKAAEQGSAIAAAVEGVERQWGSNLSAPYAFIETLRERMFKPSLSTIIAENSKVPIVSSSDPVYVAAKKMRELRVNSVVVVMGNKIQGILTSKDILMRVVAQNLSPELTLVENSSGAVNEMANTMMQKFWDSALALEPPDDYDTQSEMSAIMASDGGDAGKLSSYPSLGLGNSFAFKFEDLKGRVHRFNCGTENLDELLSAIMPRIASSNDHGRPQLLYEDDEGDKVLLATDSDLIVAVNHARSRGLKVLRLHLDSADSDQQKKSQSSITSKRTGWVSLRSGLLAGVVVITGISVLVYLKRSKS